MSVWPLIGLGISFSHERVFVGGWWQGGRWLGVGELMAPSGELGCREPQCMQPTGLGAPGKALRPYCGCLTKVYWPHEVLQPCGSEVCIARCSPAERRAPLWSHRSGFSFLSSDHDGLPVFAGESAPQWLRVEVPAVQRRGRWRALGRTCGWMDRERLGRPGEGGSPLWVQGSGAEDVRSEARLASDTAVAVCRLLSYLASLCLFYLV